MLFWEEAVEAADVMLLEWSWEEAVVWEDTDADVLLLAEAVCSIRRLLEETVCSIRRLLTGKVFP